MTETAVVTRPAFPPLLTGRPCKSGDEAFEVALDLVRDPATEPGTVVYAENDRRFDTALILAPDRPLADAAPALFAVSLGLNDAIGTLAPPEVGCHLEWPDAIRLNGARAGRLRMAAETHDPAAEPEWLVIGATLDVAPRLAEAGREPDRTTLHDEGAGEITTPALIEAFAHHMMVWLHTFITDGLQTLHSAYAEKAYALGETIDYPEPGTFLGLDERGGMILKTASDTRILPLTSMIGP